MQSISNYTLREIEGETVTDLKKKRISMPRQSRPRQPGWGINLARIARDYNLRSGKMRIMRSILVTWMVLCLSGWALSQQSTGGADSQSSQADQDQSRQRSAEAGESSSRDTRIDISPPKDDSKNHPNNKSSSSFPSNSPEDMNNMTGDVQEMHPWNPYRAMKDDEVGDYYLKQGNYKGALARYQDALQYKENDAVANFRIAQCYEKLKQPDDAIPHYREYLKILPDGPFAKQAKKALEKLEAGNKQPSADAEPK
jgi:tetratricopeptide (TPR) repeat protein